jgi:hypothetical protein
MKCHQVIQAWLNFLYDLGDKNQQGGLDMWQAWELKNWYEILVGKPE